MLRLVVQHHRRVVAIRRYINDSFGQYPNEFVSRRYDYLFLHASNKGSILKINKRILKGYFYKTTIPLYEMVVSDDFLTLFPILQIKFFLDSIFHLIWQSRKKIQPRNTLHLIDRINIRIQWTITCRILINESNGS